MMSPKTRLPSPLASGVGFGEGFTNRVREIKRLKANFTHQVNTILISPRRWGKSSLVKKVSDEVAGRAIKIVHLDLLGIRSEEEFYKVLATETIKATGSKLEEWLQACKSFFKHITPKISMGADPSQDFEIGFEWTEIEKNYKEILQLPEKIAAAKNIRIIICIDVVVASQGRRRAVPVFGFNW